MVFRSLAYLFVATGIFAGGADVAIAASDDECGIWLCLPQGFPSGCEPHFEAYIERITNKPKPKPPLPKMSECARGDTSSHYFTEGYVPYYPCRSGFSFSPGSRDEPAKCSRQVRDSKGDHKTESYNAVRRRLPHYIQVYLNNKPAVHHGVGPKSGDGWKIEEDKFWYRR